MYSSHDIHLCACGWYVTTAYLLYTSIENYVWSFQSSGFRLLMMSLGCSLGLGNNCPQALQTCDVPRHSPFFFGRKSRGSVFFSACEVVARGKNWRVENNFHKVHHRNRLIVIPGSIQCLPSLNCAEVHRGRRCRRRFRCLRWVGAVVFVMPFCCRVR